MASIRPQPEDLEPRSAASIGTRHLGRRQRRRGKEGSSNKHLVRRWLDSMSWPVTAAVLDSICRREREAWLRIGEGLHRRRPARGLVKNSVAAACRASGSSAA
ncbi:hypothetical protein VPH35_073384 [Triticum aestivum]